MIICAYDNSKQAVIGTFEIEVEIGEVKSLVEFTAIDIPLTFSLLLGRPWLHDLKAISSTIHQKIKVPLNGKIITLNVEGFDMVATIGGHGYTYLRVLDLHGQYNWEAKG